MVLGHTAFRGGKSFTRTLPRKGGGLTDGHALLLDRGSHVCPTVLLVDGDLDDPDRPVRTGGGGRRQVVSGKPQREDDRLELRGQHRAEGLVELVPRVDHRLMRSRGDVQLGERVQDLRFPAGGARSLLGGQVQPCRPCCHLARLLFDRLRTVERAVRVRRGLAHQLVELRLVEVGETLRENIFGPGSDRCLRPDVLAIGAAIERGELVQRPPSKGRVLLATSLLSLRGGSWLRPLSRSCSTEARG